MNKEGISHIEVILSFLIFIGFVIFALYFFSPFEGSRLIESSLAYAITEISKNASVNLESYSIKLNPQTRGEIGKVLEIEVRDVDVNKNARVENYLGENVPSRRELNNPNIIRIKLEDSLYGFEGDEGFALIKFSEDIDPYSNPSLLDGNVLVPANGEELYEIGTSNKIKVVSEKRIVELKNIYERSGDDYQRLKQSFNLPNRVNFGFGILFDNIDKIEPNISIPKGIAVFSSSKRIEVLRNISPDKMGKIVFADFIVRVW